MATTNFVHGTVIMPEWLNDVDAVVYDADGADYVDYTPAGTGASTTSVQTKLKRYPSAKDFGAVGDGVTDDTTALGKFFTYITSQEKGSFLIEPGTYLISSGLTLSALNDQNGETQSKIKIIGYGALIKSTQTTGSMLLVDDCKNLHFQGIQFLPAANACVVEINGMWQSTWTDCDFPIVTFGEDATDAFESHYWNMFIGCRFAGIEIHTGDGPAVDLTEFNANSFYNCRFRGDTAQTGLPTQVDYAIKIYGDGFLRNPTFYACDISEYSTGSVYVNADLQSGDILFHGCFFDSVETNITRNVVCHYMGMTSNPQANRYDSIHPDYASRQHMEQNLSGSRGASRLPTTAQNLMRNGDLRYGFSDITRSSTNLITMTMTPGMGLYGQYLNLVTGASSRTIDWYSVPLPFDGHYTATVIFRKNSADATVFSLLVNGSAVVATTAFAASGTDWTVSTISHITALNQGDIVGIRLGGTNANIDIAYVGLTYGKQGMLAVQPHPLAVPSTLTRDVKALTHDFASLADGAGETVSVTVPNASPTVPYLASFSADLVDMTMTTYFESMDNNSATIGVRLQNESTAIADLASGTLRVMPVLDDRIKARASITYDPASLADGARAEQDVTCFGAALGDFAVATFSNSMQGIILNAQVTATDTVTVTFHNETGGVIDLASGTLTVFILHPKFDYIGSATFDAASLADGAGETASVTCTGAALGDFAVAAHGVDTQGIIVTAYVSAANTVEVRFQNETGGILDLASATLKVGVIKHSSAVAA